MVWYGVYLDSVQFNVHEPLLMGLARKANSPYGCIQPKKMNIFFLTLTQAGPVSMVSLTGIGLLKSAATSWTGRTFLLPSLGTRNKMKPMIASPCTSPCVSTMLSNEPSECRGA